MKRIIYLAMAALVAMLVLVPASVAQDAVPGGDDDPHAPEQNVAVVGSHEELQQIAGQPVPRQHPGQHPGEVPAAPAQPLPSTGGFVAPSVVLSAAAVLLLGSGVLASFAVVRRRRRSK